MMKTIDKLKQIIAEYDDLDINKINTKDRLVNDFGFDSLETAELFIQFQHEFGIQFPEAISHNISIDELAVYIDSAIVRKQVKEKRFLIFSKKKENEN